MLGGLEIPLILLGGTILNALGTVGLAGGLAGLGQLTIGMIAAGTGLGLGVGAGAAALGNAGSTANPMIGGGYQAAINDAYNNAVSGSSDVLNGLNLPGIPKFGMN